MKSAKQIIYTCECGAEIEVTVYQIIPAKILGPVEQCHDKEGGDIEPTECECGEDIDICKAHDLADCY